MMSLRVFEKQSPVSRGDIVSYGDCSPALAGGARVAKYAGNTCTWRKRRCDMPKARLASHKGMISLQELQSATEEELRRRRTLLPSPKGMLSVLRPQGGAFKP